MGRLNFLYPLRSIRQDAREVSLAVHNRVLAALLDHWQLKRPCIVGHDIGGATVLRAHLIGGCDFERMVLIDPVAVSPWESPFFRHVREHEPAFADVPSYMHKAIVRAYLATAVHAPLNESVLQATVAPWLGEEGQPAFYRQIVQADPKHTAEVQPLYDMICRPVLILWGREDSWIPLERGYELQRLIPDSKLIVIDDAGHLVIEEKPQALIARISRFLGRA